MLELIDYRHKVLIFRKKVMIGHKRRKFILNREGILRQRKKKIENKSCSKRVFAKE